MGLSTWHVLGMCLDVREHTLAPRHVVVAAASLPIDVCGHLGETAKGVVCSLILEVACENQLLVPSQVHVHRTTASDESIASGASAQRLGRVARAHDGLDVALDGLRGVLHDVPLSALLAYNYIMPLTCGFVLRQSECV